MVCMMMQCVTQQLCVSSTSSHAPLVCRWNDLENNANLQQYANYGLAGAYGLIAVVALVSSAVVSAADHAAGTAGNTMLAPMHAGATGAHPAARSRVWLDHTESVPPPQCPGVRPAVRQLRVPATNGCPASRRVAAGAVRPARWVDNTS